MTSSGAEGTLGRMELRNSVNIPGAGGCYRPAGFWQMAGICYTVKMYILRKCCMANSDVRAGLQRHGVERSPALSADMFGRKPEEIKDRASTMINVGEDSGARR